LPLGHRGHGAEDIDLKNDSGSSTVIKKKDSNYKIFLSSRDSAANKNAK
jgi:hypothetical protein